MVNFLATEKGFSDERPEWLADKMMERAARTIGSRIYSMQQHLRERPVQERMKALLNGFQ